MSKESEKKAKEQEFENNVALAKSKNDYIRNIINGRYFLARSNMIAVQIQNDKIEEKLDGLTKTEEYFRAEYALQKMQAINCMREAHFAKKELLKVFKFTEDDIQDLQEDYYNGKVVREDYDEGYKRGNKAEFVSESKD